MLPNEDFSSLEEKIGYEFQDKKLLLQALTHSSFSNEQKINKHPNYERLEFLGDAVLELISSQFFFEHYPEWKEGQLTRVRSSMVCEPALAYCARDISLQKYILLGKGEEATGGRERDSIVSDVMEAVLGAIYLAVLKRPKDTSTSGSCPILRRSSSFMTANPFCRNGHRRLVRS